MPDYRMSEEYLIPIPKKRKKGPRFWRRRHEAWMATDSGDNPEHATSIENLEGRRGSVPLAHLDDNEADFFEIVERGNIAAIEKFLTVSFTF